MHQVRCVMLRPHRCSETELPAAAAADDDDDDDADDGLRRSARTWKQCGGLGVTLQAPTERSAMTQPGQTTRSSSTLLCRPSY